MTNVQSHIPRSTLQSEVVARLRTEIIEGYWVPGVRLQERLLCQRYGISRSPLREAYHVLASEGLIELSPNKGAIVSIPTIDLSSQQFTLMTALEILGAELACTHASDETIKDIIAVNEAMKAAGIKGDRDEFFHLNNEVHRRIVLASGNEPLINTHQLVAQQIIRVQSLKGAIEHSVEKSFTEHDAFLEMLKQRNRRRVLSLLRVHLKTAEENFLSRLETVN